MGREILCNWRTLTDESLLFVEFVGGKRRTTGSDFFFTFQVWGLENSHLWRTQVLLWERLEECRTVGYAVLPVYLLCDIGSYVVTLAIRMS